MNPDFGGMRPTVVLLREGTDTSQGKGQLLSNNNACQAVVDNVRTTLGPRGMDKLIHTDTGVRGRRGGLRGPDGRGCLSFARRAAAARRGGRRGVWGRGEGRGVGARRAGEGGEGAGARGMWVLELTVERSVRR